MTHMRLIGTRGILLAFVVLAVLVQAYALPLEWSRELLGTEDAALPTTAADSTGGSLDVSATSTCPSAETYRKTKRGCLCRKGYGTFVFEWDRSSANPNAKKYPTTFPSGCRYYRPGTSIKLNFATNRGRCFCFTCPTFEGVKYQSPGVGFLNSFSSGCYPYRFFFARIQIQGTSCQTLTADMAKYSQLQAAITKAFQARFKQFNNTFSPVANQFNCANGPNGDAYISFRLGYLGPFSDAQNQIISDILTNVCQTTTLCSDLGKLGVAPNPTGEANPNPLPPVTSSSPAPAPGSSPAPAAPSPAPPGGSPTPAPGVSPNPPASPVPSSGGQVCALDPLPNGVKCASLVAQSSNCQQSSFVNLLDPVYRQLLLLLGFTQTRSVLNLMTLEMCVASVCPNLALNNPSYALYAPDTQALGSGDLRCKCYSASVVSRGSCAPSAGPYGVYQYEAATLGPSPTPASPAPASPGPVPTSPAPATPSPGPSSPTPSPTPSTTASPTPSPTPSPIPTPSPSPTPPATLSPSPTPPTTPSPTPTPPTTPSPTPTPPTTPSQTPTPPTTPSPTPTPPTTPSPTPTPPTTPSPTPTPPTTPSPTPTPPTTPSPTPTPPTTPSPTPTPPASPSPSPTILQPITNLVTSVADQQSCTETATAIPPAALSLLGISLISSLQECINACNQVPGRTYASYASVVGLLPTCKCYTSTCTLKACGILNSNCGVSTTITVYKYK